MAWGSKSRARTSGPGAPRAPRDESTGLLTRGAFLHECVDALTASTDGGPSRPAVLLIELEGAGDAGGHEAGVELVQLLAARVTREVGSLGVVARTSDQQFGVLFPDLAAPAAALDLAYRVVASLSSPTVLHSQRRVQVSASCGLVLRDVLSPSASATDLLRGAEIALGVARRGGRGGIEVCTRELLDTADETIAMERDLRKALQEKGLNVCYQPMVDLGDGAILGFEALVRWTHAVHGTVSPARFVPVAEQFGLIGELGRMVLSTTTEQVQRWSQQFQVPFNAHVNVSGHDLVDDEFPAMVGQCLSDSGLPADQLVLEFTELTVEPVMDTARAQFEALHEMGVRVALDDFGTGNSALSYLQTMRVDILKVDRRYLESIDEQEVSGHRADDLLRGVVAFGQAMGMTTYGEGIEDELQRLRMRTNGCRIGQGYLFARPLPSEEAQELLRTQYTPVSSLGARILAADGVATL